MKYLLIASLFVLGLRMEAQTGSKGTKLSEFIQESALSYVEELEKKGLNVVRFESDVIFSKKTTWRILVKDLTYGIFVFGDHRVKDIDIKVSKYVDQEWVVVEKDSKAESYAYVVFKSDETKEYKIEISVYEFNEGFDSANYGLVVTNSK